VTKNVSNEKKTFLNCVKYLCEEKKTSNKAPKNVELEKKNKPYNTIKNAVSGRQNIDFF
jgi:hypothetical protein